MDRQINRDLPYGWRLLGVQGPSVASPVVMVALTGPQGKTNVRFDRSTRRWLERIIPSPPAEVLNEAAAAVLQDIAQVNARWS